jgi:alanine racemase
MAHIEINRDNFFYNLEQFSSRCGSKDKIAIVLKDNAYGHGLEIMAKLSADFGLSRAVVRDYIEAQQIKKYFKDILVLGDRAIVDSSCSFVLNSLDDIFLAQKSSYVELKIDTGMHRNGIDIDELDNALRLISKRGLRLKGIMSHYRSADELSSELFWQNKRFNLIKDRLKSIGYRDIRFHSFNSATTLRLDAKNEDMVRVGIGIYGYNELPAIYNSITLKPILSLWANRVSTRYIKKGSRVGYGGRYIAPKDMKISTYDLGYGDGWFRSSSNTLSISEGIKILGRVSMDYISLESTKDRVLIMDNALDIAKRLGTISYEIVTQLSKDIERRVISN